MKDCWKILGISPTNDIEAIKRKRRSLIKEFHPDKAVTPEKIRKNTIHCAKINDACDRAVATARLMQNTGSNRVRVSSKSKPSESVSSFVSNLAVLAGILIGIMASIGLYKLVWYTMSDSFSPSSPIKIVTKTMMFLTMGFFFGFVFLGLLDLLIFYLLMELRLFEKIHLERYEDKLMWLTLLSLNVGLLIILPLFMDAGADERALAQDPINGYYFGLLRISAALAVPLLFLYSWIQDYISYTRIKHSIITVEPHAS